MSDVAFGSARKPFALRFPSVLVFLAVLSLFTVGVTYSLHSYTLICSQPDSLRLYQKCDLTYAHPTECEKIRRI